MAILNDIVGYADNIILEFDDLTTEVISGELKELIQNCELVYDPISMKCVVKLDANKFPNNSVYHQLIAKILDKENIEVNDNMEGYYGFEALRLDLDYSDPASPVEPQEIDCEICRGTGKDKRNIIQKPCEACEGTGKIKESNDG